MSQQSPITEYSKNALSHGYFMMPVSIIDAQDKARRKQSLMKMLSSNFIDMFVLRDIIDHITYVRDYMIRKSINFMLVSKNSEGNVIGIANFVYSKSSAMLYLKRYYISDDVNKTEVLAFFIRGADNYLQSYGYSFKGLLSSPSSIKREGVSMMRDIGMKFMFMEPLSEDKADKSSKQGPVVYPIKKDSSVLDMRVVMVEGYSSDFKLDKEEIAKFLMDLKNEKDLQYLLKIINDQNMLLTLKHIDETNKLTELLGNVKNS